MDAGFTWRLRNRELNTVTKITRYIRKICHKQWILLLSSLLRIIIV
jgi:hypothetical protein